MIQNYESAVKNIRSELKNYVTKHRLQSLVIGQSGGIDSTLCTVLAQPVCEELDIPLISRSITIVSNKAYEIDRARRVGSAFASDFREIDLSHVYHFLQPELEENADKNDTSAFDYKVRVGNIKVRIRMLYLYNLAQKHRGMVLSTDNYTELLLGFWTLHGDVGDYGMIQSLWKTEVYEMSRYLASQSSNAEHQKAILDCVEAVATDGLGITNSDLDQIGAATYEDVDKILIGILSNTADYSRQDVQKVGQRFRNSEYKRNNPYNIPRLKITDAPLI